MVYDGRTPVAIEVERPKERLISRNYDLAGQSSEVYSVNSDSEIGCRPVRIDYSHGSSTSSNLEEGSFYKVASNLGEYVQEPTTPTLESASSSIWLPN